MNSRSTFGWVSAATIFFVIVAALYVTKAFITTILWGIFVAYLLTPLYSYLLRITGKKQVSSLLAIAMVFLVFVIIVIGAINAMATEVSNLSESQYNIREMVDNASGAVSGFVEGYIPWAAGHIEEASHEFEDLVSSVLPKLLLIVAGAISGFAVNMPIYLAQFGVAVLLVYYLLIDGKNAIDKVICLLPEQELISQFISELKPIYHSLFNVYFTTCVLTGAIATVGFLLLGISYPFLWGAVVAVFALLPLVGTNTIIVPMTLYYLVIQDYTRGVMLLIFGMVFLNLIPENILRPRLAMKGAAIHPVITLLAFAAPIFVVGMVGIVIGPALYGFLLAAYRTRVRLMGLVEEPPAGDAGGGGIVGDGAGDADAEGGSTYTSLAPRQ